MKKFPIDKKSKGCVPFLSSPSRMSPLGPPEYNVGAQGLSPIGSVSPDVFNERLSLPRVGQLFTGDVTPRDGLLTFCVVGKPVQWRAGRSKTGRTFTPAEVSNYRKLLAFRALAALSKHPKWDKSARFGLAVLVSYPDNRRRDLENLESVVQDALTGVVWNDDSQVDAKIAVRQPTSEDGWVWVAVRALSLSA